MSSPTTPSAASSDGAYTHLLHLLAFAYVATFIVHHFLAPKFEQAKFNNGAAA